MTKFATYNLPTIVAGSYYSGTVLNMYSDSAHTTPIDLTNYNVVMKFKSNYQDPEIALELSTYDGSIVLTDALNGKVTINGLNLELPNGKYVYDIDFIDANGYIKTYIRGTITLLEKV